MDIQLTFAEALAQFPKEVRQIENQLRRSKSKYRSLDLADFKWRISWGEEIEGTSFADLMAGKRSSRPSSLEGRIEQRMARSSVCLQAYKRSCVQTMKLIQLPKQVIEHIREGEEEDARHEAAFAALSPQEKAKQTNEALRELLGTPGFVAIHREK